MSLPLVLSCLWLVATNAYGMYPSRSNHWTGAYVLIAVGLPILGSVFYLHGVVIGGIVLLCGLSVLRWPVRYLGRWLLRKLR